MHSCYCIWALLNEENFEIPPILSIRETHDDTVQYIPCIPCPNLQTQFSRKQAQNARFKSLKMKKTFWACFRENWVYEFGHRSDEAK
jgi:hypothetical protein